VTQISRSDSSPGEDRASSPGDRDLPVSSQHLSASQTVAASVERRLWDRRTGSWEDIGSAGLAPVIQAVVRECEPLTGLVAVDLGCGTGQVTIPLARRCWSVLGVDVSPRSIERLQAKCATGRITNVQVRAMPIEALALPEASVDLVVSNYALHHLRDSDKAQLLARAHRWLRPGGRLVVGDMMFGRGSSADDRRIVTGKLRTLARRGPSGWWRIVKNLWRFGLRLREKPLPRGRWETLAREAGFTDVRTVPVRAEASVLLATRPHFPAETACPQ
jgi:SAM-dependent methyltransferase